MAIYCLENNYRISDSTPNPGIFVMSTENLLPEGEGFSFGFFDDHDLYAQCELVIQIDKPGSNIKADEAAAYFSHITTGISFTSLDIHSVLNGLEITWQEAKDWKYSRLAGEMKLVASLENLDEIHFCVYHNRQPQQFGNSRDMVWNLEEIVEIVSRDYELFTGDLIFTGSPSTFFKVDEEDSLEAFLEDDSTCELRV